MMCEDGREVARGVFLEVNEHMKYEERKAELRQRNLYVSGIVNSCSDAELAVFLSAYGPVQSLVRKSTASAKSTGQAFVCFERRPDAENFVTLCCQGRVQFKGCFVAAQRYKTKEERKTGEISAPTPVGNSLMTAAAA